MQALGLEIGYGRVIGGVHYPMELVSGQTLGHACMDVIRDQPAYLQALDKIRGSAVDG